MPNEAIEYTATRLDDLAAAQHRDGEWSAAVQTGLLAELVRAGRMVVWECESCQGPALTDPRWCDAACRAAGESQEQPWRVMVRGLVAAA